MKRREFLQTGAVLGALAAAPAFNALGKPRDRLRVAVLGTGLRGQSHLSLLLHRKDV